MRTCPMQPFASLLSSRLLSTSVRSPQVPTSARSALVQELAQELNGIKGRGTFKSERIITTPQATEIHVSGPQQRQGPLLNFCANNYLGLSSHPALVEAGQHYMDSHGAGLSSVRFICGTQDIHKRLERVIAEFHGREDAILYAACFDANAGIFETLTTAEDAIISDELNHASLIDGIRLSKAQRLRYKHMDMEDLDKQLHSVANSTRRRVIVTDGVFSMDGDVAPLRDILQLARDYHALVMVDDCHATGVIGATGRGSEEAVCGEVGACDIINSTLGKAMGGAMGGYTVGPRELIELLRQRSRPYLFSNSLAPAVVGVALKAFELVGQGGDTSNPLTKQLKENVRLFRTEMTRLGFTVLGNTSEIPICPVLFGDAALSARFAEAMLNEGIYVISFAYPVVPKEKARIRVQISAAHSREQIEQCVAAFAKIGRDMDVIQ